MGLRGRFTLWFAIIALVPIAAAAVATRYYVAESFRDAYAANRDALRLAADRELSRARSSVAAAAESLATRSHPVVGGLLLQLRTSGGELDADQLRALREGEDELMRGLDLDVLALVDDRGTILSAPHDPGAVGDEDTSYRRRAIANSDAYAVRESILRDGQLQPVLVVGAARRVTDGGRAITVVVGREIGEPLVQRLSAATTDGAARLVDGDGVVLASGAERWPGNGERLELSGPDGKRVAALEIATSNAELSRLLEQLTLATAGIAGAALLVTALLGLFVSRRITRDLDRLVVGVRAAARGDLDHRVEVRARDEIGEVASAVNVMMTDLAQANEDLAVAQRIAAWQEIARRLAHEIKNPLTPIQMSVETMRKTKEKAHPSHDEIFDESTRTILEEVGRLKRIVTDFSDFARLPRAQKQRVDLSSLVSSVASLYRGSGLELSLDVEAGELAVDADRDQVTQVLHNLIDNAREAARRSDGAEGQVRVVARRTDRGALVIVEDDGPGVPAEQREKLFTPYFTTKHASGGTGLGLAIAHRIITEHGGRIRVDDGQLGGARFTVELPGGAVAGPAADLPGAT